MSINRWMDKEGVVCTHTYTHILEYYSAIKKERIWASSSEVDKPKLPKVSQKEKQISYINAYIWNREKWYWWTYLQGKNGDTDVENGLVDTTGEGGDWESGTDMYGLPCVK